MISQTFQNDRLEQKTVLDLMNVLLRLDKLDDVLQAIVKKAPSLIGSLGCSIYLIPDLVTKYDGKLIDNDNKVIDISQIQEEILVLAASSQFANSPDKIGKYFYRAGEGLTGWVFERKQLLLLNDMSNEEELSRYPGLAWQDKYKGAQYYYAESSPKPLLAIPLEFGRKCCGVIRVGAPQDRKAFPDWTKEMFLSFAGVISRRIEIESTIREQKRSIENLIKIGSINSNNQHTAFNAILEEAQKVVGGCACFLYLPDRFGEKVDLKAATDPSHPSYSYKRNEGLTGWIFKTAKPLLINDTSSFVDERILIDAELELYSDSTLINKDDRKIKAIDQEIAQPQNLLPRFLGAPILTSDDKARGVVTILSRKDDKPFTTDDLMMLREVAANISTLITNLESQRLNEMLIRIGQEHGSNLFQYVVEQLPELVFARGCSVFLKADKGNHFELKYTNSEEMMEDLAAKKVKPIEYKPGDGKTGLVAKLGRTLVINHYGTGDLDRQKLQEHFSKYLDDSKYKAANLVRLLKNEQGVNVGLARLVITNSDEEGFTRDEEETFSLFARENVFAEKGLPPSSICEEGKERFTRSFLACPLRNRQGKIFGVLRIPRTFPGGIFTDEALELVASVSNRLSVVLEKERIIEQYLSTLNKITRQMKNFGSDGVNLNEILTSILDAVTNTLGFEFAAIQLVDQSDNTVYTALGMKNKNVPEALDPNAWIAKARHPLDPLPGQKKRYTRVAPTGTQERNNHSRMARSF